MCSPSGPCSPLAPPCGPVCSTPSPVNPCPVCPACVKNTDMSECMQKEAIDCAQCALAMYQHEKDVATYIKKEFDKRYCPSWHCFVGKNFGTYISHETTTFIYFYIGQNAFILFKSG
ncbi:unnamed protein product [Psylliodes chrysocephalus]|uniref:Dynein light chain n=1 Tax=Psylliodes chrysocephalus TaxID=3402493 RepID=A0A9P0G909_9CUCU|nr:unnamed protein product [Psylliodes chrysocephala]